MILYNNIAARLRGRTAHGFRLANLARIFPSSILFVTEFVGYFTDKDEKANDISGGGFSNTFPMPKYQQVRYKCWSLMV